MKDIVMNDLDEATLRLLILEVLQKDPAHICTSEIQYAIWDSHKVLPHFDAISSILKVLDKEGLISYIDTWGTRHYSLIRT